jgi:hypothetical protein
MRAQVPVFSKFGVRLEFLACASFGLGLILLFGLNRSAAQAPPHPARTGPTPSVYRIAGAVTNAVTGEPVLRATVTLMDETGGETVQATETGAEGRFALDPVPAGKYALHVARRGYLSSMYDEHENYSSAIVTGEGQDTEHIPFHLQPSAMVYGVVTDDAGEPVRDAQVMLFEKSRFGGLGEHQAMNISGTPDDTGAFEFWDLNAGTYYLAVKAVPWYALHPPISASAAASAEQSAAARMLDVAYPLTFYDGATEQAAATPVTIKSGDHVELNVTLHAVPAIHLMVPSPETETRGGRYTSPPQLRQSIFGQEQPALTGNMQPGPPGSGLMELTGIAPGHYSAEQGTPPRLTEFDAAGSGSQELDSAAGVPTVKVTVKVQMAGNAPLPSPLKLGLRSDAEFERELSGQVSGKGEVQFESVPPGAWNMVPHSENQALAVVSVETGGVAKQDSRIQVKDRSLTYRVVLAAGATDVNGFAKKDGKGMAGAMVVLVPKDAGANWALFRRDQSDSDGSFSLRNAIPGQYTVVAIEDGWGLEWSRPEVIGRYLSRGIPVLVTESSRKLERLSASVPVQER